VVRPALNPRNPQIKTCPVVQQRNTHTDILIRHIPSQNEVLGVELAPEYTKVSEQHSKMVALVTERC